MKKGRRNLAAALTVLLWLSLPIIAWQALSAVPLDTIWSTLGALRLWQVLALAALNLVILALLAWRWALILVAQGHPLPFPALLAYRLGSFAVSYFTPGAQFGGEPLQVYLLQKRHALPGATALAAVSLDRLFDLIANFAFLVVGGLLAFGGGSRTVILSVVLLSLPLAYLVAVGVGRFPLAWLSQRLPQRLVSHRLTPVVVTAERQIGGLLRHAPLTVLGSLLLSGAVWALMWLEYWLSLQFLGALLTPIQSLSALLAARIAFLTPLPAGVGALEASQILAMQALGVDPAVGISLSLLIRVRDVSLGLIGLWLAALLLPTGLQAQPKFALINRFRFRRDEP